jgi:hypothetical protein
MEHIKGELKPRQSIPTLIREEVKDDKPRATLHMIPRIDRKHNLTSGQKDYTNK